MKKNIEIKLELDNVEQILAESEVESAEMKLGDSELVTVENDSNPPITKENNLQCTMDANGCCIVEKNDTEKAFWDDRWAAGSTGWDLGNVSPELKKFFDSLPSKNASILIPGCGNAYEAEYLLNQGFTNVTLIDIAPTLVRNLKSKFNDNPYIRVLEGDFFQLVGKYDIIVEQTFFCAIPPAMRVDYVRKMSELLDESGILAGLLFDRDFVGGPPFGGSQNEYKQLFPVHGLEIIEMKTALNSIAARQGTEVFFRAVKY